MLLYNGQIKRTVVSNNQAGSYNGGVGIQAFATLTNLTIIGNTAVQGGGIETWVTHIRK